MIIGLTGSMGSGKGEVVKILEPLGFKYITLSQMVREEARKQGIPEEREQLMAVGNKMRSDEGLGVLAKRALEKIAAEGGDHWVVDGIRNPAEIDALREGENVHIIGMHADKEILIERILKRNRPSDPNDRDAIVHRIEKEWAEGQKAEGQQVGKCVEMADAIIENEGTLEELDEKIRTVYNLILEDKDYGTRI